MTLLISSDQISMRSTDYVGRPFLSFDRRQQFVDCFCMVAYFVEQFMKSNVVRERQDIYDCLDRLYSGFLTFGEFDLVSPRFTDNEFNNGLRNASRYLRSGVVSPEMFCQVEFKEFYSQFVSELRAFMLRHLKTESQSASI